jgi:hypothetical protein
MTTMLRPMLRASQRMAAVRKAASATSAPGSGRRTRLFGTQSGDDASKPTALAVLHLEDGTTLTGRSFGCHASVEGEVGNLECV